MLAFLKALLGLSLVIAKIIQQKQLLSAGEAVAVAKSMAELSRRLGIQAEVQAETEKMSDEELIKDAMES